MQKSTLLKILLLLPIICVVNFASAQVVGLVTNLSGPLTSSNLGGIVKNLHQKSEVVSGDTLITGVNTYAIIKFLDNSEVAMKPGTTLVVNNFSYAAENLAHDSAIFSLVKGGLRYVTGALGKRNKEKLSFKTPSATICIRGTTFFLEYIDRTDSPTASTNLPIGLHAHVREGGISITNNAGVFSYHAGQFGFIENLQTHPVKMFSNPGMFFITPASFEETQLAFNPNTQ